jgi:hypothetical protein
MLQIQKQQFFFLGIFTTVVNQNTPMQVQFLYGIWMCMVNAGWFILVAYLFTTKNIRNVFLKKKGLFEIFMGIVLIGLALRLLLTFKNSLSRKSIKTTSSLPIKAKNKCSQLLNSPPKRRTSCFGFGNG